MLHQTGAGRETLPADATLARRRAGTGAGMHPLMLDERRTDAEGLAAIGALVGFIAGVPALMGDEG